MGEEITNILPIYEKVYSKLKENNIEKMHVTELYTFIEHINICNGDSIEERVCNLLLKMGLTKRQTDSIRKKIAWHTRFSRADSREIVKGLIEQDLLERRHYNIYLK